MRGLTIGSLFAGIGGFDLAGEWCGHRTIWTSEIDPYCVALLAERFPAAKQLGDISAIDWAHVERPDIITGGFPCQDISYAGKGAGLAGKRSGLWYEYARAIREVGPRYVIVENVRALFTRGFDAVLGTLADLGYDAEWAMYGAADVGAPHQRHRVWILARRREDVYYASCCGFGGKSRRGDGPESADGRASMADAGGARRWEERGGTPCDESTNARWLAEEDHQFSRGDEGRELGESRAAMANADQPGPQGRHRGELQECAGERALGPSRTSPADAGWWQSEPDVGRVAHGVSARVDRLRGLGNAIVPACALPIFGRIAELEGLRLMQEAA